MEAPLVRHREIGRSVEEVGCARARADVDCEELLSVNQSLFKELVALDMPHRGPILLEDSEHLGCQASKSVVLLLSYLFLLSLAFISVPFESCQHQPQSSTDDLILDSSSSVISLLDQFLNLKEEGYLARVLSSLNNLAVLQEAPPGFPDSFNLLHLEFMAYLFKPEALTLQDSLDAAEYIAKSP